MGQLEAGRVRHRRRVGHRCACAATLAREGAKVMITDLDDVASVALANIAAAGGTAAFRHQDVTEEATWPGLIATEALFGRLDIIVANAGIAVFGSALMMSLADFRRQNAVNVEGVFLSVARGTGHAAGGWRVDDLMSSVAGLRGSQASPPECKQGRGAAVREIDGAGTGGRCDRVVGPSRHRRTDLGKAACLGGGLNARSIRMPSPTPRCRSASPPPQNRQRRAVPGERCLAP
jgi:NAD(P)-dependent dehydrogenase (short-subunit alcohol dehydrogenase family)